MMKQQQVAVAGLVAAIAMAWIAPALAATTIYTDKLAWESAVGGPFPTEEFDDAVLNPGVSFVASESGTINPALGYYQDVLASTSQNEPMTVWNFTPAITGYGGNWTLGGPGGSGNSLLVYLDATTFVGAISNDFDGGFWGFVADAPFNSVKLTGGSGSNQQNYKLDDMVYAPVPVPAAAWLLGSGLALLGWRYRPARLPAGVPLGVPSFV